MMRRLNPFHAMKAIIRPEETVDKNDVQKSTENLRKRPSMAHPNTLNLGQRKTAMIKVSSRNSAASILCLVNNSWKL